MSRHNKGRLEPFVPLFRQTMNIAAWRALSVGARSTFLALKTNYNNKSQNAVFLSARVGAKELGLHKDTVCKWIPEREHYGFIVEVQGAHLGLTGMGKAARYRLTDCHYAGSAPTRDFMNWTGELYDPEKQNPVRKNRTPRPKNPDTRSPKLASNGSDCPKNPDIRNADGCPKNPDITSLTTPIATDTDLLRSLRGRANGLGLKLLKRRSGYSLISPSGTGPGGASLADIPALLDLYDGTAWVERVTTACGAIIWERSSEQGARKRE